MARQAELERQAELNRQAELERQAALARQAELERQAELKRQAERARQAALARQAELAKQAEIEAFLQAAEAALSDYRLTTPAGESAYDYYRAVLQRDPENTAAIEGFSKIADRYYTLANTALGRGQRSKANGYVTSGLKFQDDHAGLLALKRRLAHRTKQKDEPVKRFFNKVKRIFD